MEKRRVLFFLLFALFSLPGVYATIGVSPAYYELDFEPGMKAIFDFRFFIDQDALLKIGLSGELAKYAKLSTDELDGTGWVRVALSLPRELEKPGINILMVTATQVSKGQKAGFGLSGVVGAPIRIRVPYPGRYAEASLSIENVNEGELAGYELTINNLGKEDLTTKSRIDIYQGNEKIEGLSLGEKFIESAKLAVLEGQLNTANYPPGEYKGVALVEYGSDKPATSEREFRIGELFIDVINHSNYFMRDKINRFEIHVESFWKHRIENVFANVTIISYPDKTFLTPSVGVDGFKQGLLTGFFDTTGIEERKFQAKIDVHYEGKVTEKIVDLGFEREINYLAIVIIASALIIVILVGMLIWLIFKSRKAKRRR